MAATRIRIPKPSCLSAFPAFDRLLSRCRSLSPVGPLGLACAAIVLTLIAAYLWPSLIPFLLTLSLTATLTGPYATGSARPALKALVVSAALLVLGSLVFGAYLLWALGLTLVALWLFADRLLGGPTPAA